MDEQKLDEWLYTTYGLIAISDTIFVIWFAGLWDQNTIKGFKDYFKKRISIHSDFKLA